MRKLRLPKRFEEAAIEQLDEVFQCVIDYVSFMEMVRSTKRTPRGLLLSGPVGVGKTYAMAALTAVWAGQSGPGGDHEFVTAPYMFDRLPAFDGDDRGPNSGMAVDAYRNQSWFKTYTRVPWLVVNDLGKENRAGKLHDQVVYKLGRVLRDRNERGLITHVTTNLRLRGNDQTLAKVYGASITSLLSEMTDAYEVSGPDRRKEG